MKSFKISALVICIAIIMSCFVITSSAADSDFVIENGVLKEYKGKGGDIVIPEGVTRIYIDHIPNSENITSISLPKTLETIMFAPFSNCPNFTKYIVNTENEYFFVIDGVLYNYDKTEIVSYPPGKPDKVFNLPNTVTKINEGAFRSCKNLTQINLGYKITEIDTAAFADTTIASFDIPDSVTKFGQSVFSGCKLLTDVTLSDNLTNLEHGTFNDCISLRSITIPKSVSHIDGRAFFGCDNLLTISIDPSNEYFSVKNNVVFSKDMKTLVASSHYLTGHYTVPEGVEYLAEDCLSWGNLSSITLPSTLKGMGYEALCCIWRIKEITIPEGVSTMEHGALRSNNFESIVLPKSLKVISSSLLYDCDNLTSVTISPGTTTIGVGAFAYDRKLSHVTVPYSITTIKEHAFIECTSLKEITLPHSVKTIEKDAFAGCDDLTIYCYKDTIAEQYAIDNGINYSIIEKPDFIIEENILYGIGSTDTNITIPSSVKTIAENAFSGCNTVKNITVPNTVAEISPNAFSECTSLESINLPNTITAINEGVFRDCTSLTSIVVPDSITTIDAYAFWGCTSLSSISIPDSVTYIGNRAFRNCTALREVSLPDSITHIDGYIFTNCPDITVLCNEGAYAWQYAVDNGLIEPPATQTPATSTTAPPVETDAPVTGTEIITGSSVITTEEITETVSETTVITTEVITETTEITDTAVTTEPDSDNIVPDVLCAVLIPLVTAIIGAIVLFILNRKGIIELKQKTKSCTNDDSICENPDNTESKDE